MFEVVGVLLVLLVLLVVGALVVRYVLRVLTGAEKGCHACPGCAEQKDAADGAAPGPCKCSGAAPEGDGSDE